MSFMLGGSDGATRPTFFELVAAERLMPSLKAAASYSLQVQRRHSHAESGARHIAAKSTVAASFTGAHAMVAQHAAIDETRARVAHRMQLPQVLSQRRPWVYRLLAYEDEVFALAAAILDHGSLAGAGGMFSESLYGLRRAPADNGSGSESAAAGSVSGSDASGGSGTAAAAGQAPPAAPMLSHGQRRAALLLSVRNCYDVRCQRMIALPNLRGYSHTHVLAPRSHMTWSQLQTCRCYCRTRMRSSR